MNTKKRNNLRKDERAVSPVIGVILMVAITVIMAAIIGAFVYGYGGSMTKTKDVAATARHVGDTIYVTYMGGTDHALVGSWSHDIGGTGSFTTMTTTGVGVTATKASMTGTNNHIVVRAIYTDGTSGVILDTYC